MANDTYTAGNLELSILGFSEGAVKSIDVTTRSLSKLASAINKLNATEVAYAGEKLENLFRKIANSTNSINTTNLTQLASAAKSLSAISRISKLEKMDFDKVGKGFSKLTVAITPFVNKVKEAEVSLVAMDNILRKVGKKGLSGESSTSSKNGLLNIGKWTAVVFLARRLGRYVGEIVQAGSDYTETLNLWQVAMRENLDLADEFVNKMNKAYGISTKTVMNAQATFKNMIGSLGQISDETAYQLSETLVQMSADLSSLYNVKLESAFQKMQAMLAGQVRPIRSAGGLDITETTLYQYYQMIGGTKSMRNLTRTEKQLLSILAVYEQMGSAGALGDMTKTLNSFANQSRMLTEYWAELKTWSGLILKDLIDQSGALVFINAALITLTSIVKAIAQSRGLGEENFIDGLFETTEATNDEIDELQGKLLDFDKFRSMSGGEEATLAIDEKVLEAITGYSSKLDNVVNKAQELANTWLENLGFIDENGDGVADLTQKSKEFLTTLKSIAYVLASIIAAPITGKIISYVTSIKIATTYTKLFSAAQNVLLTSGIFLMISSLTDLIQNWDEMSTSMKIAKIALFAVGLALTTYSLLTKIAIADTTLLTTAFKLQRIAAIGLAVGGIGLLITNLSLLAGNWDKMKAWEKVVGIFGVIGAAALTAAAGIAAFHGAWTMGTAAIAIVGALTAIAGAFIAFKASTRDLSEVPMHANGASDIKGGTLFVAGEYGKTEAVYTAGNGRTNVANVRQMEQAFYNALSRHSGEGGEPIVVQAYLDGEKVYENTTARAKARGKVWANS